jgi:hypothetical protein
MKFGARVVTSVLLLIASACTTANTSQPTSTRSVVGISGPWSSSGVRGELTYVGGPRQNIQHLEPGRVSAFSTDDGLRWGEAVFTSGHGFNLGLPAGTYRLLSKSGDAMCPVTTVRVAPNRFTSVTISCSIR